MEKLKKEVQPVIGIWVEVTNGHEFKCHAMYKNFLNYIYNSRNLKN